MSRRLDAYDPLIIGLMALMIVGEPAVLRLASFVALHLACRAQDVRRMRKLRLHREKLLEQFNNEFMAFLANKRPQPLTEVTRH